MKRLSQLPNGSGASMLGRLRILVVDTHALVGAALSGLLFGPPLSATVESVLDGEAAANWFEEADFDLIVCELSVPARSA